MALVACPSCKKTISDKALQCSHCNFAVGSASRDDIERKQNLDRYKYMMKLQHQSMIALLMFVAGVGYVFWGGNQKEDIAFNVAVIVALGGFIWYAVNRVRIVIAKRF